MMTFEEWKASARRMTVAEGCDFIGIDGDFYDGCDPAVTHLWVYADRAHIEENADGTFGVMIERDDWNGTRAEMERTLFFGWVAPESSHDATSEEWHQVARDFMDAYKADGMEDLGLDEWLIEYGDRLPATARTDGAWILEHFDGYGNKH